MNVDHIKARILFGTGDPFSAGNEQGPEVTIPIAGPTVQITPEALVNAFPELAGKQLYGFNANIQCDSRAIITVANIPYFTLANYRNTVTQLASMKVYNCSHFFRLNHLIIGRLDIENSHALVADSTLSELYMGIEGRFEKKANQRVSLELRGSEINRVRVFAECSKFELVESKVYHCSFEEPKATVGHLFLWQHNELAKLSIGCRVERFTVKDTELNYMILSQKGFLPTVEVDRAHIREIAGLFEENTNARDQHTCKLIARSYESARNESKHAEWMYAAHNARLATVPWLSRLPMLVLKYTCGFGYKVSWSFLFVAATVILFALLYSLISWFGQPLYGLKLDHSHSMGPTALFLHATYFSITSFATLGYGDVTGLDIATKLISSLEAIIGIYTMAIVVYSLTKRYLKE